MATEPVVVSANAGVKDTLTAAGRLILVVMSTAPAAALLIRKGDLIGLYNYFQSQPGIALGGALMGLASIAYGLYKSYKRGKQVADVATNPNVPDSIATTK